MTDSTGACTLKAASVNSGVEVVLNATSAKYSIRNNIKADPVASSYELTECEHRGWENPKILVRGFIRDEPDTNEVTEQLLKSFARTKGEQITLKIIWGDIGNESVFTNMNGISINGGETGIPVILDDVTFEIDVTARQRAHVIPFTLSLTEDKV